MIKRILLIISALVFMAGSAQPVAAMSAAQKQVFDYGIPYYNTDISDNNGSDSSSGCDSSTLTGSDNEEKIWNWLIANGATKYAAAGIMGNIQAESGFNPFEMQVPQSYDELTANSDSNKAWGLVQWDGGRRVSVLQALVKKDSSYKNYITAQYGAAGGNTGIADGVNDAFILFEMDYAYKERPSATKKVNADSSPADAANDWNEFFEVSARSSDDNSPQAVNAQKIYDKYKNSSPDPSSSGSSCAISSGGLTVEQAWNLLLNEYNVPPDPSKGSSDPDVNIGGASTSSSIGYGGRENCTAMSMYFVHRFSSRKYSGASGDGNQTVGNLGKAGFDTGKTPKVYSIFSKTSVHTGVVIGIQNNIVITLEAHYSAAYLDGSRTPSYGPGEVREYKMSTMTDGDYTFAYIPMKDDAVNTMQSVIGQKTNDTTKLIKLTEDNKS